VSAKAHQGAVELAGEDLEKTARELGSDLDLGRSAMRAPLELITAGGSDDDETGSRRGRGSGGLGPHLHSRRKCGLSSMNSGASRGARRLMIRRVSQGSGMLPVQSSLASTRASPASRRFVRSRLPISIEKNITGRRA